MWQEMPILSADKEIWNLVYNRCWSIGCDSCLKLWHYQFHFRERNFILKQRRIFDGDLEDCSWSSVMMIAPKYCFDQYISTPKACCSYSVGFAGLFQKTRSNSETLGRVGEAFINGLQDFFSPDGQRKSLFAFYSAAFVCHWCGINFDLQLINYSEFTHVHFRMYWNRQKENIHNRRCVPYSLLFSLPI